MWLVIITWFSEGLTFVLHKNLLFGTYSLLLHSLGWKQSEWKTSCSKKSSHSRWDWTGWFYGWDWHSLRVQAPQYCRHLRSIFIWFSSMGKKFIFLFYIFESFCVCVCRYLLSFVLGEQWTTSLWVSNCLQVCVNGMSLMSV